MLRDKEPAGGATHVNEWLKHILRQVLPPIIVDAAKRVRARATPSPPEWEAVPDSDAIWNSHDGWSHRSIADVQREKWPFFLSSVADVRPFGWPHEGAPDAPADLAAHNTIITFGHVLGCVAAARHRIRILDWGGGIGHYYVYARRLRPDLEFDYVVKDLPSLCAVGRDVLPEVTFAADDGAALAQPYDLVFASSSLQYTRDLYGLLARLCDVAAGWLMVTRSPFVDQNDDFVVVQRPHRYGYRTEYPAWFVNRSRFLAFVEARGFRLEREFMVGERPYVPNAPEQCSYRGFLFKRISA